MSYAVKEIYLTLQGEGAQAGRLALFCRFAGCNLWSGREEDRAEAACWFCDTDFVGTDGPGGGRFGDAEALAEALIGRWRAEAGPAGEPWVVFTGGEPTLQLDEALVGACHARGLRVAVETNGTRAVAAGVDWICVSPKPGSELVQRSGHELKLVFPQAVAPESVVELPFEHRFLQPRDGEDAAESLRLTLEAIRKDPRWRLSLQTHKLIGIP